MSSPIINENLFLLHSLAMGIFITFIYDILRIGRRVCAHSILFISLEDLFFWIFCAVSVFYMMHTQSNGTLRWFAVLGALAGMLLYKKTISPFFVKWVSLGIAAVFKFCRKILIFLCRPFILLAAKARKVSKRASERRRRAAGFVKKRLTRLKKLLKMALCKQ